MRKPRMSTESPYTYTILRYVHDIGTAEFINVGVVVSACDTPCIVARFRTDCRRVKCAFPSLNAEVFLTRMQRLQACFDAIDAARCSDVRACGDTSIAKLVRCVLPLEDRALTWSPSNSGIGGPIAATLQSLYERLVTRHDKEATR